MRLRLEQPFCFGFLGIGSGRWTGWKRGEDWARPFGEQDVRGSTCFARCERGLCAVINRVQTSLCAYREQPVTGRYAELSTLAKYKMLSMHSTSLSQMMHLPINGWLGGIKSLRATKQERTMDAEEVAARRNLTEANQKKMLRHEINRTSRWTPASRDPSPRVFVQDNERGSRRDTEVARKESGSAISVADHWSPNAPASVSARRPQKATTRQTRD